MRVGVAALIALKIRAIKSKSRVYIVCDLFIAFKSPHSLYF